ncbi:MAG: DUF1015 domain-containing protein [Candidatus Helarchaeota archaeon]
MPKIKPFKGYYFNVKTRKDLEALVAPPHDVISPAERSAYLQKNPNNIVQIILPESYSSAAEIINKYIKESLLVPCKSPSFYLYETKYFLNGAEFRRVGLVALVELTDFSEKQIIPHERTFKNVTEGRLQLFRSTRANYNPIFFIFNGNPDYSNIIEKYRSTPPFLIAKDKEGVEHSLWIIEDRTDIQMLQDSFQSIPLLIADGHHRYLSALTYSKESGHKYVMGLLVDMNDPSLKVFPTHRLIRVIPNKKAEDILTTLSEYFQIIEFNASPASIQANSVPLISTLNSHQKNSFGLVLYSLSKAFIIILKAQFSSKSLINAPYSSDWKQLDVSLLHEFVFKHLLNVPQYIEDSENIHYIKDLEAAIPLVQDGFYQALFILKPPKVEEILRITSNQEIMPHKSTYFYPKPLSGLIIYKWDDS